MDWKGVEVLLQRAAKDYDTYREASAAVALIRRAEQDRDMLAASVAAFRDEQATLIGAIQNRTREWAKAENDLATTFQSSRTTLTEQLADLRRQVEDAQRNLADVGAKYADLSAEYTRAQKAREAEAATQEAEYADRLKKAEARLAALKAEVASL